MVLLRTSEGIWEHVPHKNSSKIMSFELHLKKLFLKYPQNITIFSDIDIVSKLLLATFSGIRPDDFIFNCEF